MATLTEHTAIPQAEASYEDMQSLLESGEVSLVGPEGTSAIRLPEEVLQVLTDALDAFRRGTAVTVLTRATTLTTQEAADMLGVSRPTLVKLLEEGAIPFEQPLRHRRVALRDVLSYSQDLKQRRSQHLAAMAEETGATPTDEIPDVIVSTR